MLSGLELKKISGYDSFKAFNDNVERSSFSEHTNTEGIIESLWKYHFRDAQGRSRVVVMELTRDELFDEVDREVGRAAKACKD
jgi:hypothetical protein